MFFELFTFINFFTVNEHQACAFALGGHTACVYISRKCIGLSRHFVLDVAVINLVCTLFDNLELNRSYLLKLQRASVFYNKLFSVTFDEEFARAPGVRVGFYNSLLACLTAVTVVIGMRMMGTLLISALIIFPVLTAVRLVKNYKSVIIASVMVALAGFFGGLILSVILGTSPGSSVVIVNLLIFLGVRIYGLVNKK